MGMCMWWMAARGCASGYSEKKIAAQLGNNDNGDLRPPRPREGWAGLLGRKQRHWHLGGF